MRVRTTPCFLMQCTADTYSSVTAVDIFNSVTGMWSTAQLSTIRRALGATSVGNVALFAGGGVSDGTFVTVVWGTCCRLCGCRLYSLVTAVFLCSRCLFSYEQSSSRMSWIRTTSQQESGQQLSSAWHAVISQLQRYVTWHCSQEATVLNVCFVLYLEQP